MKVYVTDGLEEVVFELMKKGSLDKISSERMEPLKAKVFLCTKNVKPYFEENPIDELQKEFYSNISEELDIDLYPSSNISEITKEDTVLYVAWDPSDMKTPRYYMTTFA